jgi:hypothetical protein
VQHRFNFYGLIVEIDGPSAEWCEDLRRDFTFFHVPVRPDMPERCDRPRIRVELCPTSPPYEQLPAVPATVSTPRNVCFRSDGATYIDYFGAGLAIFHRREQRCVVYAADDDLAHEIAYLFILSTVGQHLDRRGLHRLHALGVSYRHRGVAVLLPMGGGKSTLALELLRRPGFRLLSDDTPLIDRRGRFVPFPLRLGVRPEQQTGIPSRYLRTVRRMEFDPKTLIDLDYFADRLSGPVEPGLILVGQRNLGDVSTIVPLARRDALQALIKNMVVGLGVYQGMEFVLERGVGEVLGKAGVATSRLRNSLRLLSRAPAYRFVLGRDRGRNTQTLVDFINRAR